MRTWARLASLATAVLLAPAAPLRAADLAPPSRIDAVTVYLSSARVTRATRVDLPAGAVRVLVEGLPDALLDDSLRVEGAGAARARVHGVSVERVTSDEAMAADVRAAEARLERLQDEDRALADEGAAAAARREFVASLRSTYSEERAKNLAVRGVSAKEWAELAGFVAREQAEAAAAIRQAAAQRRELAKRVAAAQAEIEKLQAKRGRTSKTAAVELQVDRGGAFELHLSYVVPNASWRPIWDARLDPEKRQVELAFHGSVQQSTGEDWGEVTLALSTAQPGRGLYVPELFTHWLDKAQPPRPVRQRGIPGAPAAAPSMAAEAFKGAADLAEPVEELEHAEAAVTQGLLSATFTAPRRESVDGAGRARKVMLSRIPLEAELMRVSAPRQDPAAYLTAKAVNATGTPLLAGEASVFVGDEFVGRAQLPLTAPGGELQLAFGADDRVKIERRMVERRHETAGIVSKDDVYRYRTLTKVKNLYGTAVKVRVLDLVPVSRDEAIEVKLLEGTTAANGAADPAKPGVRTHEVELKPGEERSIDLRYEVRFPRGQVVAGLE